MALCHVPSLGSGSFARIARPASHPFHSLMRPSQGHGDSSGNALTLPFARDKPVTVASHHEFQACTARSRRLASAAREAEDVRRNDTGTAPGL